MKSLKRFLQFNKSLRPAAAMALVALMLGGGCYVEDKISPTEMVKRADDLLEGGGLSDFEARAIANAYYRKALAEAKTNPFVDSHANLGLALIKTFNLLESFVALLDTLFPPPPEDGSEPGASAINFNPKDLYRVIEAINTGAIGKIAEHYTHVAVEYKDELEAGELSLYLENTQLVLGDLITIELSGELDAGEVRLFGGIFSLLAGIFDMIFAYDKLPETIFAMLLSDEFNLNYEGDPAGFFNQAPENFPNPLLDPAFGVAVDNGDPALAATAKLTMALHLLRDCFVGIKAEPETDEDQTDDILPADNLIGKLIQIMNLAEFVAELGGDSGIDIDSILGNPAINGIVFDIMIGLFGGLYGSAVAEPGLEIFDINEILGLVLGFIPGGLDISLPGMKIEPIFTNPPDDLKTLFPSFYPAGSADGEPGDLLLDSEQESFTDDDENGTFTDGELFDDLGVDGFVDANADGVPDMTWPTGYGNPDPGWPHDRLGIDGRFTDKPGVRKADDDTPRLPPLGHDNPITGENDPSNGIVDHTYFFWPDPSFSELLQTKRDPENDASWEAMKNHQLNGLISTFSTLMGGIEL